MTSTAPARVAWSSMLVIGLVSGGVARGQVDPVANGTFELMLEPEVGELLVNTPADTCIGLGHQILYGDQTVQHEIVQQGDPESAIDRALEDPAEEVLFLAGIDHCVFSTEKGTDIIWFAPAHRFRQPLQWSVFVPDPSAVFGDFDGDGDFEARILRGARIVDHNLWQSFASHHQFFTANFAELHFTIESGTIPAAAEIRLGLVTDEATSVEPEVLTEFDCELLFDATTLHPDPQGRVRLNPVADAVLVARDPVCADEASAFDAPEATQSMKRTILDGLRIAQHSYWGFNRGNEDVVLDDVGIDGARTLVEASAGL